MSTPVLVYKTSSQAEMSSYANKEGLPSPCLTSLYHFSVATLNSFIYRSLVICVKWATRMRRNRHFNKSAWDYGLDRDNSAVWYIFACATF